MRPCPRSIFQQAVAELIHSIRPDYWVTFAFNRPRSIQGAEDAIRGWQALVDRKQGGPRWQSNPANRTQYVGIIEKPDLNIHVHAAIHVPICKTGFWEVAHWAWNKVCRSGDLNIQDYGSFGAATYSAKCISAQTSDRIIICDNASRALIENSHRL